MTERYKIGVPDEAYNAMDEGVPMQLRGRVGRHNRDGGRQCQNWPDDQQSIVGLLNRISVGAGGSSGSLSKPVIAGICSDELYRAISTFEDKYFPGQRSGYVDPGGAMLKRMEDLTAAPPAASGPIDFVTPVVEYAPPSGATKVISRASVPFISSRVMFVGIVGDRTNVVKSVTADPNAVTIEEAGMAAGGIHWLRLSRPRGGQIKIQANDAKGTAVARFEVSVIELPKASGPMDFEIGPADPAHPDAINLNVYKPADDDDYIDNREHAIGYNIYLYGFQVYCTGMDTPIEVPYSLVDLNLTKAEPIDAQVYDTLTQANEAIVRARAKAKGVTQFAYYRGAGGAVIAPTIFSPATTPRIVATYYEARTLYANFVIEALTGVAIGLVLGVAFRTYLGRVHRTSSDDPEPPRNPLPPPVPQKIRPVNDTVNVGGGGEIPNVTNLNPIKPGSGGPTSGIPNHVPAGMEKMDEIFAPGSVKTMYSQRLRYGDVDWPRSTQAAANVMPPGGKVSMNVWTQSQQEVNALRAAFERAGFRNVRIWGSSPGPGTMLDAVR
jgi:hypothetical protein